jgi:hypothetical protein
MTLLFKERISFISVYTRELPVWPLATQFAVSDLLKIMGHACAIGISTLIPVFSRRPAIWNAALAQHGSSLQPTICGKDIVSIQLSLYKNCCSETHMAKFGVIMKYRRSLELNFIVIGLLRVVEGADLQF